MKADNRHIIWLVSYPKSGNTWVRTLVSNYISGLDRPVSINNLLTDSISSNRLMFEEATGLNSSELSLEEINQLRPAVYQYLNEFAEKTYFVKVHDAYSLIGGLPLFPHQITKGVVHIVRNPLDVAVSYAFHAGISMDQACAFLCNKKASFCTRSNMLNMQLEQHLMDWGGHLRSWEGVGGIPYFKVRYEDLLENTFDNFRKILEFAGSNIDEEQIGKAVKFSTFDVLKAEENEQGFREKPVNAKAFFREGKKNGWNKHLKPHHVKRIVDAFGDEMARNNYMDH
jgi:aryl sulfotransferase